MTDPQKSCRVNLLLTRPLPTLEINNDQQYGLGL